MTNKIIAQSSRFRAVRTSRDRVRIKGASNQVEHASLRKVSGAGWVLDWVSEYKTQDLLTFIEATWRTLE